jgi:quercetin dioxygenase-like cupin family protein
MAALGMSAAIAQTDAGNPAHVRPGEIRWPAASPTGAAAVVLAGPLDRPVLYVQRVKIAKGGMVPPHTHPDTRYVTVLSGSLYAGRGAALDAQTAVAYPSGSYFVVPAGTVHYAWARDGDVEYQESGIGPTATQFLKK